MNKVQLPSPLVVRFAPSPTGTLHLGNARTALFNYLLANNADGTMLLRIEDTDQQRSTAASEQSILEDLTWLGIAWDCGPDKGGPTPPYRQSEAGDYYGSLLSQLQQKDAVYPCFCTADTLAQQREQQKAKGEPVGYPGTCRHLTDDQIAQHRAEGRQSVWRLRYPERRGEVRFADAVRGEVGFPMSNLGGDMILMRADGSPTFHFAVVADDHRMGVTFILRGEDHLANTAKQLLLYEALGWEPPQYGHMAMILGSDKTKLSKRHGGVSVDYYRQQGVLPQALFNYLSLLGWSPGDDTEFMLPETIIERFSVDRLVKSAAVFDEQKLYWLNGLHLRELPEAEFIESAVQWLRRGDSDLLDQIGETVVQSVLPVFQGGIERFAELPEALQIFRDPALEAGSAIDKILAFPTLGAILDWFESNIDDIPDLGPDREVWFQDAKTVLQENVEGAKGKTLFQPLRLVITGRASGRDLGVLFAWMPTDLIRARIRTIRDALDGD